VCNWVFDSGNTSLLLGFIPNEEIFFSRPTNNDCLTLWIGNDGREYSTRLLLATISSLYYSGSVINNQGLGGVIFVAHVFL
jgi:hypothetical protein